MAGQGTIALELLEQVWKNMLYYIQFDIQGNL